MDLKRVKRSAITPVDVLVYAPFTGTITFTSSKAIITLATATIFFLIVKVFLYNATKFSEFPFNHLTPNGHFSGRTAPLTYRCSIFYLFNKYTY
jgi:hypothetical protein